MSDDDSIKNVYDDDDEEVVVDILECCDDKIEVSECNDDDTDVCSNSSFSGTVSQLDDDDDDETQQTASNDQEAHSSMMCTDSAASLPSLVRKKKLSDHWRRFIHPITWRCKWLELKIKELQSQAGKYDKELQESCQAKQLELENLKSEEELGGVKAVSLLPCHAMKTRLKKRKKRKRVEEASSDVPSYALLNHNLFSYHENRKCFGDVALNDYNSRNLGDKKNKNSKEEAVFCEEEEEEEETSPFEFREGDAFLEQILLKIEAVKLQASSLKNRVEKMVNENPSRFSLVNPLNMLGSEQQNEETPVSKPTSVSSHHNDTQPEDDDGTTDILLSEMMASIQRKGKAIVPNKKLQKTEQALVVEGSSSRPVRIRKPRNLDVEVKEETKRKRRRVSKEKPLKRPNRQRKRGKRRSGSRRRS